MSTLNVMLDDTLKKYVEKKIATGHYASASEVIREALRLHQPQDEIYEAKLARLRQDVEDGFNSGLAGPLDMEEIIRKV